MGTIADKTVYLDGTKDAIHDAIVAKGVNIDSGATFRSYATSIAAITTGCAVLPDLVAGGTYKKQSGSPVVITPISGETTAIRLLVATTGQMKTALVLTFTGSPVIDWGDGTTTNPTNNVAAVHQYDGVNPIPCGRSYGVYLITISGGTVTAIASSNSKTNWGGTAGNIISAAIKSASLTSANYLFHSDGGGVFNSLTENIYIDAPLSTALYMLYTQRSLSSFFLKTGTSAISFQFFVQSSPSRLTSFDLSNVLVNGDLTMTWYLMNASSVLLNPLNTQIGNVDIQINSMQTAAYVALFNSLPTLASTKNLLIGNTAASMALTTEQIQIATTKNWNVIRS